MERIIHLMRITAVEPLDEFQVRLTFNDELLKIVDLDRFLHGPIFEPIRRNRELFLSASVRGGTIAWGNGADIDPNVLYYDLDPDWGDDETDAWSDAEREPPEPVLALREEQAPYTTDTDKS